MKVLFTFLSLASAISAQSTLAPPHIGFVQDSRGHVHSVLGLAGNFLIGRSLSSGAIAAAHSGSLGLIKTDRQLIVTDAGGTAIASNQAPAGSALFGFSSDGVTALAYFESASVLMTWNGRGFQSTPLDTDGTAVTVALVNSGYATVIIERHGGLYEVVVSLDTGAVVSREALPDVTAPAFLLASGDLVYTNRRGLVVRTADRIEKQIAAHLPKNFILQQMGNGWIEVRDLAHGRLYALDTQYGHEAYFTLPEVRQ